MAKTRTLQRRWRLSSAASVFMRVSLPPDFVMPDLNWRRDLDLNGMTELQESDDKWAKCFGALSQVPHFHYLKCARLVENPAMATFFISTLCPWSDTEPAASAEALEALLESQQFNNLLAALGLETPPPLNRTIKPIWAINLSEASDHGEGRVTIATLSFPYPATPEQWQGVCNLGCIPMPNLFYERSPFGWGSRTLHPRPNNVRVSGPQTLPDGREVDNALLIQNWRFLDEEDAAAGEERETRERWMSAVAKSLGLLAISVDRYDIYGL